MNEKLERLKAAVEAAGLSEFISIRREDLLTVLEAIDGETESTEALSDEDV